MTYTIKTNCAGRMADTLTPVSIYLKMRDLYQSSVLLESTDFHHLENCFSFIGLDPIAGITVKGLDVKMRRGREKENKKAGTMNDVPMIMDEFFSGFSFEGDSCSFNSFFGYLGYEALSYFETLELKAKEGNDNPDLRFDLYRFVIAFNHMNDEITIIENQPVDEESGLENLLVNLRDRRLSHYRFTSSGDVESNMSDEDYIRLVKKAKDHCRRGDVFQLVLSRSFKRRFRGDEFNVYRCLRSLNPSPYLFYFDYGSFRIFGSSPESQIIIKDGVAGINPIAGTFARTGDDEKDKELSVRLSEDPKENAEHVMLVDLARNDLSRSSNEVKVESFKEIHYYSHVIHIVSKVSGILNPGISDVRVIGDTFPAGTLTGAPKFRAMELIDNYEPNARGYYGGCIGMVGVNGGANLAITIRSFMSRNNVLHYQAGAGLVERSEEKKELAEVYVKLAALEKAILNANDI
jgi:anthranilate synthase component 1